MAPPAGGEHLNSIRRALKRAAPTLSRELPWVGCGDPWAIVVSEFMLQQTQTSRVIAPWQRFLDHFPTPTACANAPLGDVLRLWEGLGFHRRAKFLHDTAIALRDNHGGTVPRDVKELRSLPGVGAYTANAIASFAFGTPTAVLDTNVGRILARAVANRRPGRAVLHQAAPLRGLSAGRRLSLATRRGRGPRTVVGRCLQGPVNL